jgi:hypothetical protein
MRATSRTFEFRSHQNEMEKTPRFHGKNARIQRSPVQERFFPARVNVCTSKQRRWMAPSADDEHSAAQIKNFVDRFLNVLNANGVNMREANENHSRVIGYEQIQRIFKAHTLVKKHSSSTCQKLHYSRIGRSKASIKPVYSSLNMHVSNQRNTRHSMAATFTWTPNLINELALNNSNSKTRDANASSFGSSSFGYKRRMQQDNFDITVDPRDINFIYEGDLMKLSVGQFTEQTQRSSTYIIFHLGLGLLRSSFIQNNF